MRIPEKIDGLRRAFTLVELLMVMFVMALITTIVASNAFGISRSASYTAAQDSLYNALVLAHQQACMNNHEVCVVFLDETSFVLVEAIGKATRSGQSFVDFYPLGAFLSATKSRSLGLWNVDDGKKEEKATLTPRSDEDLTLFVPNSASVSRLKYGQKAVEISGRGLGNLDGKAYGVETMSRQTMPRGFKIGFNSRTAKPNNSFVRFLPDGSCDASYNLYAYEEIRPDKNYVQIFVASDGSISVKKSASGK